MDEIRVFPGVSIETEGGQLALKFIRMIGESQEAYVQRLQQVTDLALSFVPKSEPAVFDFSDTSKYRKINEHSYELITPGRIEPERKECTERDTHFAGWASSLWDELHTLFAREGDKERYEAMDKEIIARAGYDLVKYVMENTKSGTLETAHFYFDDSVSDIPDMTAWPEQE